MNLLLVVVLAASLPTFEEFRRADRERRESGQLQTAESMKLLRIDPELIVRTAKKHPNDPLIQWGAAELFTDWEQKRAQFEKVIASSTTTNVAVALRFGCAAAQNGDAQLAMPWLKFCEQHDTNNVAAWLAELSLRQGQFQPPSTATQFHDYGAMAARARIALLDAAGYTPYAARRLGFVPDMATASLARGLAKPPIEKGVAPFLLDAGRAMQEGATYVLMELIGQSLERAVLINQPGDAAAERLEKLVERRDDLTTFISSIEKGAVEQATESEMVQYFDDVLTLGEEAAMKKLAESVKRHPSQ